MGQYVLGADLKAFVLIFPNNRGVSVQELGGQNGSRLKEETFGIIAGEVESAVIVA